MDAGKLPTPALQRSRCRTISRKSSQPSRRRRQCSRSSPARTATQSSTDSPPQSDRTHARAALRSSSKCWRAAKRSTHSSVGLNDHTDVLSKQDAKPVAAAGRGIGRDDRQRPPLWPLSFLRQDVGVTDVAVEARIVPANESSWDDLEAVLGGASCHGGRCYCQRFKLHGTAWP